MVGLPKTLADLRRIEAQVRVTCRSCKATEVWELDALIAEVRQNGGNTDWQAARWALNCPRRCHAPIIDLLPLPFGRQRARLAAYEKKLINLALQILRAATLQASRHSVDTVEVRLALHALRPLLRQDSLLNEFWEAGTSEPRHPWSSCHPAYRRIVARLGELNLPIEDSLHL